METHLKAIAKIIHKFRRDYNFNLYYFKLEGVVTSNIHSCLTVECYDEFDGKTVYGVKIIKEEIYESLRMYLERHNITKSLYIYTERCTVVAYFRQTIEIE